MSALPAEQSAQTPASFDVDVLRRMYAKDCTNDEFTVFCATAKKYGLDPSLHQIWAVKYGNNPASFIIGRDGLLEFAHRSGFFDGMESGTEGDRDKGDLSGWAKVYRTDMTHPFCVTVDYLEYVATDRNGKPTRFWAEKPKTMITKVAEAQALRKAFRMTGVYCEDEMPSAELRVIPDASSPAQGRANPNKCVKCQTDVDPEHIETILEHTGGVPMCNYCFSDWYKAHLAEKLHKAEVVNEPTPDSVPTPEPEPVTLVMCSKCGNGVEPAYVDFSQEKTGKVLCQRCFEAWTREQQAAKKQAPKPAAPEKPKHTEQPKTLCQTCGKEIAPGTTHCQACVEAEMGHSAPPAPVQESSYGTCTNCGAAMSKKDVSVCKICYPPDTRLCKACIELAQQGKLTPGDAA